MNVRITDIDGKKPSFTQWDVDRVLLISGVDSQPALHFANHELRRAIVVLAEEDGGHWTCKVPNFILQFAGPMAVSVFLQPDDDEGKTVATAVYPVIPKMKPQDYSYTENIGYINWVVKSEEVQNLIDTIQTMLDNGELKGDTGPGASVEVTEDTDFILVHGQYQNMRDKHVVDITDNTGSHTFTVRDPYPLKLISNKSGGKTSLWFYTDDFFPVVEVKDGEKGDKGDKGDTGATGQQGAGGADGYSPTVAVTNITGGHRVTITDVNGTRSFDVMDGDGAVSSVNGKTGHVELDAQDVGAYEKPSSGIPANDLAAGVIPANMVLYDESGSGTSAAETIPLVDTNGVTWYLGVDTSGVPFVGDTNNQVVWVPTESSYADGDEVSY